MDIAGEVMRAAEDLSVCMSVHSRGSGRAHLAIADLFGALDEILHLAQHSSDVARICGPQYRAVMQSARDAVQYAADLAMSGGVSLGAR